MKKPLSLLLAIILIASLAGCGGGNKAEQNTDEPTDRLVVYIPPDYSLANIIKTAYRKMQGDYPDIEIEVHDYSSGVDFMSIENYDAVLAAQATYYEMLKGELAAGKGSDLIIDRTAQLGDIHKIMASGILYDINGFMNYDETLDISLYNQAILTAGMYRGQLLCVPVSYSVLQMATTEESAAHAGVSLDGRGSFKGFLQAVVNYGEKADIDRDPLIFVGADVVNMLLNLLGYAYVDYENNRVNVDGDDFKLLMEASKCAYSIGTGRIASHELSTAVQKYRCVFYPITFVSGRLILDSSFRGSGQTPFSFPLKSPAGNMTATVEMTMSIPTASPNKVNAYRLLQYMLSEEVQNIVHIFNPVHRAAAEIQIDRVVATRRSQRGIAPNQYWTEANPQSAIDETYALLRSIDHAMVSQWYVVDTFILPEMQPYFNGTDSYENCLQKLKNKLTLYLNE